MFLKSAWKLVLCVCTVSAILNLGCAHGVSGESTRIMQKSWTAPLDECREVTLSFEHVQDRTDGEPVRKSEQLVLKVRPRKQLKHDYVLKIVERGSGSGSGQFDFDHLQIRSDESRQKIWFVETSSGQVIATLDRSTGAVTGPDDLHPAWAEPDGGVILRIE